MVFDLSNALNKWEFDFSNAFQCQFRHMGWGEWVWLGRLVLGNDVLNCFVVKISSYVLKVFQDECMKLLDFWKFWSKMLSSIPENSPKKIWFWDLHFKSFLYILEEESLFFLASAELAVDDERSWWFGWSGTWVPQTLWYCGNCKILVQGTSRLWKAKRSWCKNSIVLLAYSSLRMEANFWFWIYILDLAVLLLYPWMVFHSRWLWLSVTVAILTVLG